MNMEQTEKVWIEERIVDVLKTVYDPCPPGYSVPDYMAFSIFSRTMANFGYYDEADYWNDVNAQDRNGDGVVTMDDDY